MCLLCPSIQTLLFLWQATWGHDWTLIHLQILLKKYQILLFVSSLKSPMMQVSDPSIQGWLWRRTQKQSWLYTCTLPAEHQKLRSLSVGWPEAAQGPAASCIVASLHAASPAIVMTRTGGRASTQLGHQCASTPFKFKQLNLAKLHPRKCLRNPKAIVRKLRCCTCCYNAFKSKMYSSDA